MFEIDQVSKIGFAKRQSREEGEQAKAMDIARNLLGIGLPAEQIMIVTGLSLEIIQGLQAQL